MSGGLASLRAGQGERPVPPGHAGGGDPPAPRAQGRRLADHQAPRQPVLLDRSRCLSPRQPHRADLLLRRVDPGGGAGDLARRSRPRLRHGGARGLLRSAFGRGAPQLDRQPRAVLPDHNARRSPVRRMRIWHQSFTVLQHLGAYEDALRSHFARVARPGTEIVMHGMDPGTYRSNYPGEDIRHAALQYLHGMQFVAAGLRAEAQGYDAFAISSLPDPALREIRSMLEIPVVGYGESAMLTACLLGRKFGVLAFIS